MGYVAKVIKAYLLVVGISWFGGAVLIFTITLIPVVSEDCIVKEKYIKAVYNIEEFRNSVWVECEPIITYNDINIAISDNQRIKEHSINYYLKIRNENETINKIITKEKYIEYDVGDVYENKKSIIDLFTDFSFDKFMVYLDNLD